MDFADSIQRYLDGPAELRQAIDGLSPEELDSTPIAGTWSIRQVICHIADAEILYADRMKKILAENEPALAKADPAGYLANLGVATRVLTDELKLIEAVRTHIGRILSAISPEQWERRGIHSSDGPMTLWTVLERVTVHIPHHVAFINEKRRAIIASRP